MFGKIVQNVNQLMGKESTTKTMTTTESNNNSNAPHQQQQPQQQRGACAAPPPSPPRPPFSFDNDYAYPSLFQEADEMLQVSLLIYTVTDLRTLAKKAKNNTLDNTRSPAKSKQQQPQKQLVTPERILELPLTLHTCLEMIQENLEQIKMTVGDGNHEMTLSSLQSIQRRCEQLPKSESGHWTMNLNFLAGNHHQSKNNRNESGVEVVFPAALRENSQTLHAYGDENPDTDLVYAVGQDAIRKRITVAFRGSVTPMDFLTDANIVLRQEENSLKKALSVSTVDVNAAAADGDPPQGDYIGIHNGFYEYLFKPRKSSATKNNTGTSDDDGSSTTTATTTTNKFTEILQIVNTLFQDPEKRRTYKLYVTGHSLGGALATLFSYKIAEAALLKKLADKSSEDEQPWLIPTPVTCVSIASPRVGALDFSNAFQLLERRGLLRHLRVANHRDPVTIMRPVSGKKMWAMLSPISYLAFKLRDSNFEQRETYRHTGMKLRLFKPKEDKASSRVKGKDDSKVDDDVNKQSGDVADEKLFDITYSGATRTSNKQEDGDDDNDDDYNVAVDNDDSPKEAAAASSSSTSAVVGAAKKSFFHLIKNKQDMPEVSFHLGIAYCENLDRVKNDLKDLKLNDLYKTKAANM